MAGIALTRLRMTRIAKRSRMTRQLGPAWCSREGDRSTETRGFSSWKSVGALQQAGAGYVPDLLGDPSTLQDPHNRF